MTDIAETMPVSKPARWTGRVLSGLVIVFLLFDGAIKLVPWPVVTETMDKMGYGSSETLARSLGHHHHRLHRALFGAADLDPRRNPADRLSRRRDGIACADRQPLVHPHLFGLYLGLMVWGGLWLRDRSLRNLMPFRR